MSTNLGRVDRVYVDDSDFAWEGCGLKFTLTYDGELRTNREAKARQTLTLRKHFHHQLKRLWEVNPLLSNWMIGDRQSKKYAKDWVQNQVPSLGGYSFVPLVTQSICVECALEYRVLRSTANIGNMPDIDNQIKVINDALKMPQEIGQFGDISELGLEYNPFFGLAQDDRLITRISSLSDELLSPVRAEEQIGNKDVRVQIDVFIRPNYPRQDNVVFYSSDSRAWDHKYDEGVFDNPSLMTNAQLRATSTQCIYRILALVEYERSIWGAQPSNRTDRSTARDTARQIWSSGLCIQASALASTMLERVYGDGPYPDDWRSYSVNNPMMAGANPLEDAAGYLEALVRLIK